MSTHSSKNYKGYVITTSSLGSSRPPYKASFSVTRVKPDGSCNPIGSHECEGAYNCGDDAHAAANVAARQFIDSLRP